MFVRNEPKFPPTHCWESCKLGGQIFVPDMRDIRWLSWIVFDKPEVVVSGLLGIFLRVVETTIGQPSTDAPAGSSFGAVTIVHRFGSYLSRA